MQHPFIVTHINKTLFTIFKSNLFLLRNDKPSRYSVMTGVYELEKRKILLLMKPTLSKAKSYLDFKIHLYVCRYVYQWHGRWDRATAGIDAVICATAPMVNSTHSCGNELHCCIRKFEYIALIRNFPLI